VTQRLYPFPSPYVTQGVTHVDALEALLATGRCKLTVVHGTDDRIVPCANSKRIIDELQRRLSKEEIAANSVVSPISTHFLEGVGHVAHEEVPDMVATILASN
jgi:pimeloyl-ACP methyl ester carboxylesterase